MNFKIEWPTKHRSKCSYSTGPLNFIILDKTAPAEEILTVKYLSIAYIITEDISSYNVTTNLMK